MHTAKPIQLSVHKNTAEKRRMRRVGNDLVSDAKRHQRKDHTAGYAIVTWDERWNVDVTWNTGRTMPSLCVPEFCKNALIREMNMTEVECRLFDGDPPKEGA